jgi:hypothetical protein
MPSESNDASEQPVRIMQRANNAEDAMNGKTPCSHAYLHRIDSDGNTRCGECNRVIELVEYKEFRTSQWRDAP